MIKHLNYSREEVCLKLSSDFDETTLSPAYEPQLFPDEITTTIYFGATSSQWKDVAILSHLGLGIKVRFYESKPRLNLFLVDESAPCVIELKSIAESYGINTKVKAGDIAPITYGEFLKYISDLSADNILHRPGFESIGKTLMTFIDRHKLASIIPVGATSYQRQHFTSDNHRISLDRNVSYYLAVRRDKDVIFSKALDFKDAVLEIKKSQGSDVDKLPVIKELERQQVSYSFLKISKGMQLGDLMNQEIHDFVEPELDERADNDWIITEREIKLDAASDPRLITQTTTLRDNDTVFSGVGIVNINYQRVYDVGPSGIVYMSADLKGNDPMLKYKFFVENDEQGALVRREVVIPYTSKSLQDVAIELEPGVKVSDATVTPYFCRNRIKRNVYMADTRNVFEIYGDHSSFMEGDYDEFNQVEIEYAGIICKRSSSVVNQQELEDNINSDFIKLRAIVLDNYRKAGNLLTPSTRSKYDWAKKQVFNKVKI